jgi:hypothetical protein
MKKTIKTARRVNSDLKKGAMESDQRSDRSQVSMTGQLPHRSADELIKEFDSDFPEPGGNPEHSGEPESKE